MDEIRRTVDKEGKYFLLDKDEVDPGLDAFQHSSLVDMLVRIMAENSPPYAVGIFGRWGSGKSTLVNFFKARIEKLEPETKWVQVSVWNHGPETLPQASYRQLMTDLGTSSADVTMELNSTITLKDLEPNPQRLGRELWILLLVLAPFGLAYIAISVCAHMLYMWSQGSIASLASIFQALSSYAWMPFIGALAKYIFDRLKSFEITREVAPPNSLDQYAERFSTAVKGKRVVVLVDDLDRLAPKKIVRALEVIKSYMNAGNGSCIFLIPCDDQVLRNAVDEVKALDEPDADAYLEKFFQFRVRVPYHVFSDLKDYAFRLLSQVNSPLVQMPGIEDAVQLLVHPDVKTPRQVKKLINEFSSLYYILKNREEGPQPLIPPGETIANLGFIATLAILRSDFPEFYAEVEENPGILEYMQKVLSGQNVEPHQRGLLTRFLVGTVYGPSNARDRNISTRNQGLVRILKRNSHTIVSDIRPYLYLKADRTKFLIKDETARTLAADISSGNTEAVRRALGASQDKSAVFEFALDILETKSSLDLRKGIGVLYDLAEEVPHIPSTLGERVANFVIKYGVDLRGELLDPKGITLLEFATDIERRDEFVASRLNELRSDSELEDQYLAWYRELLRRPQLCLSSPRLTELCRQLVTSVPGPTTLGLLVGCPVGPASIELMGQNGLQIMGQSGLEVDGSEDENELLVTLKDHIIPEAVRFFPETVSQLLTQFLAAGDDLASYALKTILDLPDWIPSTQWLPLLVVVTENWTDITEAEFFENIVQWTVSVLERLPDEEKAEGCAVVIEFLKGYIITGTDAITKSVLKHAGSLRKTTADHLWGGFDSAIIDSLIDHVATPKGETLQAWVLDWYQSLAEEPAQRLAQQVNDWLHSPEDVAITRSARVMTVRLRKKGLILDPTELAAAVSSASYPMEGRKEVLLAVAVTIRGWEPEDQVVFWGAIADNLLSNPSAEEFQLGILAVDQLPWPPPEPAIEKVLQNFFARLPGVSNPDMWNRAFPVLHRLRQHMTPDQLEDYHDWIVEHFDRDRQVATVYATYEWPALGAQRRSTIIFKLHDDETHAGQRVRLLEAWGSMFRGANSQSILDEWEALLNEDYDLEVYSDVIQQIMRSASPRTAAEVAAESKDAVLSESDQDNQEAWLLLHAHSIGRAGREIQDCSQVFVHFLSGDAESQELGFRYLREIGRELTVTEEQALFPHLARYLRQVPAEQLAATIAGVREISRNRKLLQVVTDRWDQEKEHATEEIRNAVNEALSRIRRKRKWISVGGVGESSP